MSRAYSSCRGSRTEKSVELRAAAILSSLNSTRRRHGIDPQRYLTRLLINLPATRVNQLERWLPNEWKRRGTPPPV